MGTIKTLVIHYTTKDIRRIMEILKAVAEFATPDLEGFLCIEIGRAEGENEV